MLSQLLRRHHQLRAPMVAVADVHVLDETHDYAGAAEALHQLEHRVIGHPALHDGIDLDGSELGAARLLDAGDHLLAPAETAAHARAPPATHPLPPPASP